LGINLGEPEGKKEKVTQFHRKLTFGVPKKGKSNKLRKQRGKKPKRGIII